MTLALILKFKTELFCQESLLFSIENMIHSKVSIHLEWSRLNFVITELFRDGSNEVTPAKPEYKVTNLYLIDYYVDHFLQLFI